MPIKPENRAKYPTDWQEIRERIRLRSGDRCEWPGCGAPNRAVGYWDGDRFVVIAKSRHGADERVDVAALVDGRKVIEIVLTVAHVHDPDPANCADENLAHWCQRHHNRHDAPMRRKNAAATRKAGKAIGDLFNQPGGDNATSL